MGKRKATYGLNPTAIRWLGRMLMACLFVICPATISAQIPDSSPATFDTSSVAASASASDSLPLDTVSAANAPKGSLEEAEGAEGLAEDEDSSVDSYYRDTALTFAEWLNENFIVTEWDKPAVRALDSSVYQLRAAPDTAFQPYLADRKYDYQQLFLPDEQVDLAWLTPLLAARPRPQDEPKVPPKDIEPDTDPLLDRETAIWLFAILVFIILAILFVRYQDSFMAFLRGEGPARPEFEVRSEEELRELDFDHLVARAYQEENWPKVVRLVYLHALRLLVDANQIAWRPQKTNRQYVLEVQHASIRASLQELTFLFEHIWYGQFRATNRHADAMQAAWQNLRSTLTQRAA